MAIKASQVKELRQRSGAGMMDCKKALVEHDGDVEAALLYLQKKGMARAAKKAGRTAAEGLVATVISDDASNGLIIEVNCETDFVSRNDQFKAFVAEAASLAAASDAADIDAFKATNHPDGLTIEDWAKAAVATIGENVQLRRLVRVGGEGKTIGSYIHAGSQIGVLVEVEGQGDAAGEFARNVAMHVAAANPTVVDPSEIDADAVKRQEDIFTAQVIDMGKPANIAPKIVVGKLNKWRNEISLLKQPYVKEPDQTVGAYQKAVGGVKVTGFVRYQVGDGIEKAVSNLADEVAAITGG